MHLLVSGNVPLELVPISPGEFRMGSDNLYFSESPAHSVKISSSFLLGKYPITQAQWLAVMGENPSEFRTSPDQPVDSVNWDQATAFCRRLSEQSRLQVRLPSESEWEYACRAGTASDFFFGPWGPFLDDSELVWDIRLELCEYAWFDLNSNDRTWPVGLKRPNPWGLHDMLGNVWEWCEDVWHDDYSSAPANGSPWTADAESQPRRCLRGGAWNMNAFRCRSSYRSNDHRELATNRFGLRVAISAEPDAVSAHADTG